MNKKQKTLISFILIGVGVCCVLLYLWLTFGGRPGGALSASGEPVAEEPGDMVPEVTTEPDAVSEATAEPEPVAEAVPEAIPSMEPTAEPMPEPVDNPYGEYFLANEDMAAWLQVPGMNIDYPVMWTPRDEEYYLRRGFDGQKDNNGCLILDTDSAMDPLTTNLIIHGHNMRSGAMFGHLMDYEDPEFGAEHSEMFMYTPEGVRTYQVLAVFYSQVYKKSEDVFKFYKFFQADTQEEFDDFYDNIMELSLYDTGVTVEFGDHFLTLSTCAYHVENGRFVVVAKEVSYEECYLPLEAAQ